MNTPRWQELQEQWNRLVPYAQACGIPRVRVVKIGAEAISYREQRLTTLKSQLKAALGEARFTEVIDQVEIPLLVGESGGIATLGPLSDAIGQIAAENRAAKQITSNKAGFESWASDALPLRNFDIAAEMADGSIRILKVHARHLIAAIATSRTTAEREWTADELNSIISLREAQK